MLKYITSPLARISFGLVMVTISALLVSDMLGMVPDTRRADLNSRKVIAESLAVQFSIAVMDDQFQSIEETLKFLVQQNQDVLSSGVRTSDGNLLAQFGGHEDGWTLVQGDKSTATQIQVPLATSKGQWGTVELRFVPLGGGSESFSMDNSFLAVVGLVAVTCFIGYLLFLKRTLRELDPSAVIPERVRLALDTLSEGLLIVDQDSVIVFANHAFARRTGLTPEDLVGRKSASLPWEAGSDSSDFSQLPWDEVLEGREVPENEVSTIRLVAGVNKTYAFTVNASPINAGEDEVRGALITFDDITEVEKTNEELKRTLGKLEKSQREITNQNQQLHILATRDPLTNLLNRRSFFQGFESLFADSIGTKEELACVMVDIDHFKMVNDRFGHSVGDTVIKLLAKVLSDFSRPNDLVGRFGGEEFCLALPGANVSSAANVAERMRRTIEESEVAEFKNSHSITISIGVSDVYQGASSVQELVDQADKALYHAKESGRNRLIRWPLAHSANNTENVGETPDNVIALNAVKEKKDQSASHEEIESEVSNSPQAENDMQSTDQEMNPQAQDPDAGNLPKKISPSTDQVKYVSDRALLSDRIDQAILRSARYKTQVAVLSIELESLQRINQTMGFAVGEKLSVEIIQRIKNALRSTDTVALTQEEELLFSVSRPGGDELVVLLTDLEHPDTVTIILQRLFVALGEVVESGGVEFYIDANIGVSLYPLDSEDSDVLMSCATGAMIEAKKIAGNNNYQFYSAEVNNRSRKQLRMESDLHRALEREELIVYYQPKVDMKTGVIVGMEALLRWNHPHLGMVPPNEFIPIAEQSHLIEKISDLVIATACEQIKNWQNSGYGALSVSVNLSPLQFRNPNLADQIISLVKEADIPLEALECEITETVVVQNMQLAINILEKLNKSGVAISIDDFGVGYSSFNYLKNFPIDKIKIDRSFISDMSRGPTDAALISGIVSMGHSLGLVVVAEGVETEEQLHFLQDLHCDVVQGYLVSKPLPADEMSQLLSDSSRVKRLITEHAELMGQGPSQSGGPSVFGILNEFPAMVAPDPGVEIKDNKH